MLPSKITKQIQVIASPGSEFRSGDYLLVQVLKRLIGDKWAIGYKGKVFSAISEVELKPGEKILTQVIRSGKKLILQIKDSSNDTPSDTGTRHASPLMAASGLLIKSLLLASINLRPEILAKIGKIYQDLKRNNQGREARIAGAIASLLDKQIDPSCRGFAAIVKILSLLSGDENNGGRKDRWSEKEEDLREWIKKISDINSADNEENGNPLQVFNHLKALNESWVVIPYRFIARGVIYQGLIKLLLDTNQRNVKCMILDVRQKEEIWSFLLRREKTKMKLVLCSNNASIRKSIRKKISSLLSKLQNHGVEIDDSIYDEGEFDGFSFPEEGVAYPSVNTYS